MLKKEKAKEILNQLLKLETKENDKWKIIYEDIISSDKGGTAIIYRYVLIESKITEDVFNIEFKEVLDGALKGTLNIISVGKKEVLEHSQIDTTGMLNLNK